MKRLEYKILPSIMINIEYPSHGEISDDISDDVRLQLKAGLKLFQFENILNSIYIHVYDQVWEL